MNTLVARLKDLKLMNDSLRRKALADHLDRMREHVANGPGWDRVNVELKRLRRERATARFVQQPLGFLAGLALAVGAFKGLAYTSNLGIRIPLWMLGSLGMLAFGQALFGRVAGRAKATNDDLLLKAETTTGGAELDNKQALEVASILQEYPHFAPIAQRWLEQAKGVLTIAELQLLRSAVDLQRTLDSGARAVGQDQFITLTVAQAVQRHEAANQVG